MDKLFSLQQVSRITGLTVHTLRSYEKIGLLEGVARSEQGYRQHAQSDLAWIEFLMRWRETGMPISRDEAFFGCKKQRDIDRAGQEGNAGISTGTDRAANKSARPHLQRGGYTTEP